MQESNELARARLAYVTAGQPPLGAPRRAVDGVVGSGHEEHGPEPGRPDASSSGSGVREAVSRVLTRKHALVVGALLLIAAGVTVFAFGQSAATEVPIAPVQVSTPPAPTPSPTPSMRVHVAGAVTSPGVVTVRAGSIVQDAIVAAGGLTDRADPAQLNLAAPVTDGMQILIGTVEDPKGMVSTPTGAASGPIGAKGRLSLNTATPEQLDQLPGIGPVTAAAIIAWREENGGFTATEQLQEIGGIGPKTYEKLAALVTP